MDAEEDVNDCPVLTRTHKKFEEAVVVYKQLNGGEITPPGKICSVEKLAAFKKLREATDDFEDAIEHYLMNHRKTHN